MNYALTSTLFIILHIAIIILFLLFSHYKGWLRLDHRSLFQQKLFWFSIALPIFSFFYYGTFSWWGHYPNLSASGFEIFYAISKVPLLFLAASVPLASIVNNIHRTIQTEKQINEAERKNLADSYYNHFKHTLDLLKNIESKELSLRSGGEKFTLKINNPVSLYSEIYTDSSYTNGSSYKINENFKRSLELYWERINKSLGKLSVVMSKNTDTHSVYKSYILFINIYRIEFSFEMICRLLSLENFEQTSRPKYTAGLLEYNGLFHDAACLKMAIEELNKICLKIYDVITANSPDKILLHPSYFLKRRTYITFYGYTPVKDGRQFYSSTVHLQCNKRRQSGDSEDKV